MAEPDVQYAITPEDDQDLSVIQGSIAGVKSSGQRGKNAPRGYVEFMGRDFRVAEKTGLMPLLKFSDAAEMSTADPRALSAMYAMLKDSIYEGHPACGDCKACKAGNEDKCPEFDAGDWQAFERHAMETKAEAEDLLDVVTQVIERIMGRPTEPPGASSRGRQSISGGSTGPSSKRRAGGSRR